MDECIAVVEHAFRLHGESKAVAPGVLSMHAPHGGFHIKAGMLNLDRSYFAAKVNGNFPENLARFGLPTIQGVIVLCDAEKGCPLAVMDSRDITSLRTGAATAVAAKHLARKNSQKVTICGCGTQGRIQIKALSCLFKIRTVFAYDTNSEQALVFSREMTEDLGIPVHSIADLPSAVKQSEICVTCTPARQAYLAIDDVLPGTFIAAVGADNPEKQELDPALMANSKIVTDILEQCAVMGDLHHALDAGLVTKSAVHAELGEIVARKKAGRESDEEVIVFDSTGMALQDVAAAARVYEKAQEQGSGMRLNFAA
jgi:ornithine cyclodeaminase/alanine dehydrogenase-like protein (mu-crystallin family)